jgi:hypothetical protein
MGRRIKKRGKRIDENERISKNNHRSLSLSFSLSLLLYFDEPV